MLPFLRPTPPSTFQSSSRRSSQRTRRLRYAILVGRRREGRPQQNKKPTTPLSQPPKNLTASVATLKAEVNATKSALATEVALKLGVATVDATLPRFVGGATCYVDDATGDVVGLQFGSSAPLCSTAGTPRTFAVPTDGYIADVKVAVDKATGLVGELAFVVKSNASLVPNNVVTCGTHGGVGVSVMPKLAALAGVTASCKPAHSGRRLHQAGGSGLALDPVSLSVVATTVNAPASGAPMYRTPMATVTEITGTNIGLRVSPTSSTICIPVSFLITTLLTRLGAVSVSKFNGIISSTNNPGGPGSFTVAESAITNVSGFSKLINGQSSTTASTFTFTGTIDGTAPFIPNNAFANAPITIDVTFSTSLFTNPQQQVDVQVPITSGSITFTF